MIIDERPRNWFTRVETAGPDGVSSFVSFAAAHQTASGAFHTALRVIGPSHGREIKIAIIERIPGQPIDLATLNSA